MTTKKLPRLDSVSLMYKDCLHELSMFGGGFINFGYWTNVRYGERISAKSRLESQKNLYLYVAKKIGLKKGESLIDVGCGLGLGSRLLLETFDLSRVIGVDASKDQVSRAIDANRDRLGLDGRFSFQRANSEDLPFDSGGLDKIITIEAAQHFGDFEGVLRESFRVLKRGGKFGMATFFERSSDSFSEARKLIPTIDNGVDKLIPIDDVKRLLDECGFTEVIVESIGERVWKFLDMWVAQGDLESSWDRNWYIGYKKGLFDYFVVTGKK